MALHCASNELLRGLLGLGSTQHGGHRFSVGNLLRVVRAPLMVEVTMAVEVTMVTAMMEVTVVVEVTMVTAMVEATMVEATMVEVTTVVVVTVVVVVVATVVVEVTAMAAMVEVAVMVKVTAVERFRGRLLEFAAHLQEFRHWDVAGVAAGEVRTALGIALYDSLYSGGHLGAFRQRAAVMTCHVLSTLPVAFDNLEAFIAAFLHALHGMRRVAIAMVPHRNALGEVIRVILLDVLVIVAGHHKTTKAKKAGEERHE